jgi:hypothetical protein
VCVLKKALPHPAANATHLHTAHTHMHEHVYTFACLYALMER